MNIHSMIQDSINLLREVRKDQLTLPGQMNLLDLTADSHLENKHSNILAFLLDPYAPHHHKEFGEKFLSLVMLKCSSLTSNKIITVTREKPTSANRRIDIYIETESDIIILENKLAMSDLDDQMNHYINWANETFKKNVIALYLSPDGGDPSSISLPHEHRKNLINEGKYTSLSYREDILPWLNDLVVDKEYEKELYSALVQYTDAIKGLCRLKEENKMEDVSFAKDIFNKYGHMNRTELVEVVDAIELARNQINYTIIVNFIRELHTLLSTSNTVFYTHRQKRYINEEEWLVEILRDTFYIGLEVGLENSGSDMFGLGIEFSSTDMQTYIGYGVMLHGSFEPLEGVHYPGEILSSWKEQGFIIEQNPYWSEVIYKGLGWAVSGLIRSKSAANWETENKIKLVEHIYLNWFSKDLERYKSLT